MDIDSLRMDHSRKSLDFLIKLEFGKEYKMTTKTLITYSQ